jgi:hypothetical protein
LQRLAPEDGGAGDARDGAAAALLGLGLLLEASQQPLPTDDPVAELETPETLLSGAEVGAASQGSPVADRRGVVQQEALPMPWWGPFRLANAGATCHLNVVIQVILACSTFRQLFWSIVEDALVALYARDAVDAGESETVRRTRAAVRVVASFCDLMHDIVDRGGQDVVDSTTGDSYRYEATGSHAVTPP